MILQYFLYLRIFFDNRVDEGSKKLKYFLNDHLCGVQAEQWPLRQSFTKGNEAL